MKHLPPISAPLLLHATARSSIFVLPDVSVELDDLAHTYRNCMRSECMAILGGVGRRRLRRRAMTSTQVV